MGTFPVFAGKGGVKADAGLDKEPVILYNEMNTGFILCWYRF